MHAMRPLGTVQQNKIIITRKTIIDLSKLKEKINMHSNFTQCYKINTRLDILKSYEIKTIYKI